MVAWPKYMLKMSISRGVETEKGKDNWQVFSLA